MINQELLRKRVLEIGGIEESMLDRIEREVMCVAGRIELLPKSDNNIKTIELRLQNIITTMKNEKTTKLNNKLISELLYSHTRRVMKTASKIMKYMEPDVLASINKTNLMIAIIGHDIGKLFKIKQHPIYSVFIMNYVMRDLDINEEDVWEIFDAILVHAKKKESIAKELNLIDMILMDADLMENMSVEYRVVKLNQDNYIINVTKNKTKVLYDSVINELIGIKNVYIGNYPNIRSVYGRLYFDDTIKSYDEFIENIKEDTTSIICSDIEI